jgi:hypothetical protein
MAENDFCMTISRSRFSITSFVVQYGLVVLVLSVSLKGGSRFSASYTVALLEKII